MPTNLTNYAEHISTFKLLSITGSVQGASNHRPVCDMLHVVTHCTRKIVNILKVTVALTLIIVLYCFRDHGRLC